MARGDVRNFMRERIAHLAARLMATDGIEDFGLAKRKAARQAGATEACQLPNNEEIDAQLRLYRELYQQSHPAQLLDLRRLAVAAMNELARFDPYLTGPVLTGSAGKFSRIYLHLFTDNIKGVEHYMLDSGIKYRSGETQLYAGTMSVIAPTLSYDRNGVEIQLTLLSPREFRFRLKTSAQGKPIERADRKAVEALLEGL
jgi:hypothetical protein